jgi:hypothetical protein
MPDEILAAVGLSREDIATLRRRFAAWPRTAEAADAEPRPASPGNRMPGRSGAEHDAEQGWEPEPGP